jgi:hypothetical protein
VRFVGLTLTRVLVEEAGEGGRRVSWEEAAEVGEETGDGEARKDEVGIDW